MKFDLFLTPDSKPLSQEETSQRKADHIQLALESQVSANDRRFNYEPMLYAHPQAESQPFNFLGKKMRNPIWASSMTGGAQHAGKINKNLALACGKFGLGMGLGSCRILLGSDDFLRDFQLRTYIGDEAPLFANLGIAQVEQMLEAGTQSQIIELIDKTETDGLIVHVNPLQEWLQPEGDRISHPPIETIKKLLDVLDKPLIIKEVGQGFGPKSLEELMRLPLDAIDFGAFGGTNFAILELLRSDQQSVNSYQDLAKLGHTADEMILDINRLIEVESDINVKSFIISGGVQSFLDGYYYMESLKAPSIYGQASALLKPALVSQELVEEYLEKQVAGLRLANQYLTIKK
ncbi:MAG: isopentenyl-diphosphate delta-isomerase [Bacteroidia bacterium]